MTYVSGIMRNLIFFLLLSISYNANCQGGYFYAKGKIIDSETKEKLQEAYICIPTTGFGTAPNLNGDFLFKFPNINLDSQVVVSMLGYKSNTFKANTLTKDSNTIALERVPLVNAAFGHSNVKTMLKEAIDSIPVNYSYLPVYQNGFYQEQVSLPLVGTIKANEGVLRVERFPNEKVPFEKVKLLRGRRLEWTGQTNKIESWGFQNGSDLVCRSIESSLPDFFEKSQMKRYDFQLDSLMTTFDGMPLLIIHFWPIHKNVKGAKEGTIYLEPESKAIVRIEYQLTEEGIKDLINSNKQSIKISGNSAKTYVQYRIFQNKWRLQDSKTVFNIHFEEKLDNKFKIDAEILMRFVVFENMPLIKSSIYDNEILTNTNNFPLSKQLKQEYWLPYNYLMSTVETEKLSSYLMK